MAALSHLSIAEVIIYIILLQPTLYVFWKHGKHGFLGWFYLQLFCIVRIVGNVYQLIAEHDNSNNKYVLLIASVGLSPLLLASLGLLHEGRRARNPNIRSKLEWFLVIQYHAAVSLALVFIIIGVLKIEDGQGTEAKSTWLHIGLAIIIICWPVIFLWSLISLRQQRTPEAVIFSEGRKLLFAVLIALPFALVRLIYGAASMLSTDTNFTNNTTLKVIFSVIPEIILVTIFVVAGISTRNMWKRSRGSDIPINKLPSQEYGGYAAPPLPANGQYAPVNNSNIGYAQY